jgi:multiple sugar transport system permease protein
MALVPGLYVTLKALGLLGGLAGLIALNTAFNLPFSLIMMKVYFDRTPTEVRESAVVDGASEARTFVSVMLPIAAPGTAAVALYTAIMAWNDFLFGLTMTSGGVSSPITVGIASLVQPYELDWGAMAAIGTLAALPVVILAIIVSRRLVAAVIQGAVKG